MNIAETHNIYALIESYIIQNKKFPDIQRMREELPFFDSLLKEAKVSDKHAKNLVHDFYIERLNQYHKETWKFPYFVNLLKYNETYREIFSLYNSQMKKEYKEMMLRYFCRNIEWGSKSKMRNILVQAYKSHQSLFHSFYWLNVQNVWADNDEFQKKWSEVQKILIECEESLLWRMERWQFGKFSSSTRDRFYKLLLSLFPKYHNIWVTTRHI